MFRFLGVICVMFSALIFLCCGTSSEGDAIERAKLPEAGPGEKVATFAEGCFWHSEIIFQSLEGVNEVVSGYCGGKDPDPFYDNVKTGNTGHAESVQVYYDSTKISYQTLVKAFFASHDPTSLNRQGQDEGTEYRSIAFYRNEAEKKILEAEIEKLNASHKYSKPIVTEVNPFLQFFPAEQWHQEYVRNHADNDYVKYVTLPEYYTFKTNFPGKFKQESF